MKIVSIVGKVLRLPGAARRMRRRQVKPSVRVTPIGGMSGYDDAPMMRVRAQSRRASVTNGARLRLHLCTAAFAVSFGLLGVKLWDVSTAGVEAGRIYQRFANDDGSRPEIHDRNGALLAVNLPVRGLEIDGRQVWDAAETARQIATVLPEVNIEKLTRRLADGAYVTPSWAITPAQEHALFSLGLPGAIFVDRMQRYYPQHKLASHVVGHSAPGEGGMSGLEAVLDDIGEPGRPLVSSIDVRVQQALEDELTHAVDIYQAEAAWGGVIDVRTGEMVAIASLPDYNPNAPALGAPGAVRNRAVYDRYELGSIFKVFTAAAALDSGRATEETEYDVRGGYKVANWTIRDFHGEERIIKFSEVVQYSSNIGAATMAAEMGPRGLKAALANLGLLDPLPIRLKERRAPQPPAKWGPVETATVAYGHGVAVTPLHALAAFAAVVNGGQYISPTFLKRVGRTPSRRVFTEETSAVMRRVLRRVVTDGTASKSDVSGYYTIGKTGTAEKPSAGKYSLNENITTFVGAFPGYAPRYAVLVSLDHPLPRKEDYNFATAGWNAAPLFAQVTARIAPILQIVPAGSNADPALEEILFDMPLETEIGDIAAYSDESTKLISSARRYQ